MISLAAMAKQESVKSFIALNAKGRPFIIWKPAVSANGMMMKFMKVAEVSTLYFDVGLVMQYAMKLDLGIR